MTRELRTNAVIEFLNEPCTEQEGKKFEEQLAGKTFFELQQNFIKLVFYGKKIEKESYLTDFIKGDLNLLLVTDFFSAFKETTIDKSWKEQFMKMYALWLSQLLVPPAVDNKVIHRQKIYEFIKTIFETGDFLMEFSNKRVVFSKILRIVMKHFIRTASTIY